MAEKPPAADSNPREDEEDHVPEKAAEFPTKPCFIVLSVCFFALFILIITTVAVQAWAYLSFPNIASTQFSLFKCTDCDAYMHGESFASLRVERCAIAGWDDGLCELYVAMDRASVVVIVCEISILVMIIMVLERLAFHMGNIYYGEKNILHVLAILMMGAQATALGYWVESSNVTWDDACRVTDRLEKPMMCGDTGSELLIVVFLLTEILCLGLIFGVYKTKTVIEQKRQYFSIGKISQQGCICGLFFYLITVVFIMVLCMALHDWVIRTDNFPFKGSLFSRRESDGTTTPYNLLETRCDWENEHGQCRLWDRLELASIDYVYVETVSWVFIVLWMQGIIGAAVRRHYAKPVITLVRDNIGLRRPGAVVPLRSDCGVVRQVTCEVWRLH